MLWGQISNSQKLSGVSLSNLSNYHHGAMRRTAKNALSYGVEAGLNLRNVIGNNRVPVFYPFVRYEYYNPQQRGEDDQAIEARCQVSKWVGGLNWFALPNLVVKADWSTRKVGTSRVFGHSRYNRENEFSIGVAYTAWFWQK